MAYEQDRIPALPPLRKIRKTPSSSNDEQTTSKVRIANKDTMKIPVDVEIYSTRAGGSDSQPRLPVLRKVDFDRNQDVKKNDESYIRNSNDTRVSNQPQFSSKTSDSSNGKQATSKVHIVNKNTIKHPADVEIYSTRAGGSDPQPRLPALRKVDFDRNQDVKKNDESHIRNSNDTRVSNQPQFSPKTSDSSNDKQATSKVHIVSKNTIKNPADVEIYSTRAGGSDPQPKLPALRKVDFDRNQDVQKNDEPHVRNSNDARAPRQPQFFSIATWTIIAVFAFWISNQLLLWFSYVLRFSSHDWRFYVTGGLVLIPFALLLFVSYRVFLLFRSLPSFSQIYKSCRESYELKDDLLHGYLEKLPDSCTYAESVGFENKERDDVVKYLDLLRGKEKAHYSDEVGWLDDFYVFNNLQRSRANKIIGYYSKLIGLKTAASPWKLVDIICVFYNSTLMVADLAKLYNRRVDRSTAFRLVFRWFLNIYISGELGQISEKAAEVIGEHLKESVKDTSSDFGWLDDDWVGAVTQSMPFLAKFAGKIVEGGVNAFFAIRMGRKAVAAFEPLVSDKV